MLTLGGLGFAAPWALTALVLLPALWWLLRAIPPAPARIVFPPFRLLASLSSREQAAERTPWWLLALRLVLAMALILGIAGPVLTGSEDLPGTGPVILIVDNGWAAAHDWDARMSAVNQQIDRAERENRSVVLLPTAPAADAPESILEPLSAGAAREAAQAMQPQPWATDRPAATARLAEQANREAWPPAALIWIADGLDQPEGARPVSTWLEQLSRLGRVTVLTPRDQQLSLLIRSGGSPSGATKAGITEAGSTDTGNNDISMLRAGTVGDAPVALRLLDAEGGVLSRQEARFADGERRLSMRLDLPTELAARLHSVRIEGENTAGSVLLIDARSQRRAVGLVGDAAAESQPLLGAHYYLQRALQPFAEVRHGDIPELLSRPLAMLVMADIGSLDPTSAKDVQQWIEHGGVLLRFAGPRLARDASGDDPLLPVALRAGDRAIGGTLSWSGTGTLAPFDGNGPFSGLAVSDDVTVQRQVIAEPSLNIPERTWAHLQDGTPLITGVRRGHGWVVLVHTSASPDWSNLPLSGLFVDILRRVLDLATGGQATLQAPLLPPLETLDGFGRLGKPPAGSRPIAGSTFAAAHAGPNQPPGFYGTTEAKLALNLGSSVSDPVALPSLPAGVRSATIGVGAEQDLRPWLLGLALFLMVADLAISLWMRRLSPRVPRGRPLERSTSRASIAVLLVLATPHPGHAQTVIADGTAEPASLSTRLAYVRTGDPRTDQISEAGLAGLTAIVNQRTAAELGAPVGIDPEHAELAFYPVLYWPVGDRPLDLSPDAVRRLSGYMRSGGTIVFDTRGRTDTDQRLALRELARTLDLPLLAPIPDDHVLHRSFYLMGDMPGRRAGGTLWIEPSTGFVNDGVSSVIAGSSDWAAAWAVDDKLRPMFAVIPGGEEQREQAYRFGVNLVMYVLTGNYKADQVHLPTILDRLAP